MGLTARVQRLAYVYGWRLKYWWYDTDGGRTTRICLWSVGISMAGYGVVLAARWMMGG